MRDKITKIFFPVAWSILISATIIISMHVIHILIIGIKLSLEEVPADSVFKLLISTKLNRPFHSIFLALSITFMPFYLLIVAFHLLEKYFKFDMNKYRRWSITLILPIYATVFLTIIFNEQGFNIFVSVLSFLALLSPLIRKLNDE